MDDDNAWARRRDDACLQPTGSLYRVDADYSIHRMATGFTCSNGLGWSPDNRIMYFTDSMVRTIWAYEFNLETGSLGKRTIFAELPSGSGVPDGLTVDSEGFVWSAVWDGWRVIRYAPDGTIDRVVSMPVQRPSSCMFGGPDLSNLVLHLRLCRTRLERAKRWPAHRLVVRNRHRCRRHSGNTVRWLIESKSYLN